MNTVYTLILLCIITVTIFWLLPSNRIENMNDTCQLYNESFERAHPDIKDGIEKPFLAWCYTHKLQKTEYPTYRQAEKVYDALLRTGKY